MSDEQDGQAPARPPEEAYATRSVMRTHIRHRVVRAAIERVEDQVEQHWLLRRWREAGSGRPLVLALAGEGQLRWVVRSQADAANRWKKDRYPSLSAYQVNIRTGEWTETRHRYVHPRQIVEILPASDPLVRKVWAVALRRTLGVW